MKKLFKVLGLLIVVAALMGSIAGCSGEEEETGETTELPTIKIAISPNDFHLDVLVAIEKGYFEDAGVIVDLVEVSNSPDALALISRGDVEGIFLNAPMTLSALSEGVKIKPVCGIGNRKFAIVVRNDSGIESFEDLDGKTLATSAYGPGPWFAAICDIEEYGIEPEVIPMSSSDSISALIAGKIDAITGGATNISLYPDDLTVIHLCHQSKYIWNGCSWSFTEEFLESSPDVVEKFIAALTPAREFIKANTLDSLNILALYKRIDPVVMMSQDQLPVVPDFPIPPVLYVGGFYKVNDLMVEYGYLDEPVDVDAHMDTRFVTPLYEY